MNRQPITHFRPTMYDRCHDETPRFMRNAERTHWIAVCATCGQTATAEHANDLAMSWNRTVRNKVNNEKGEQA